MLFALLSATALAWNVSETPDGEPLHFAKLPIRWTFDPEGAPDGLDAEAQRAAVTAAFEAWTGTSETEIEFLPDPEGPPQGVSRIYWANEWTFDDNFLAVTTTEASPFGEISAFDMVLNPNVRWTTEPNPLDMDFQNTVTHEIGHGIGFLHSEVEEATMHAQTLPGATDKRDLAPDDIAGMRYLYPPRAPEKTPLEQLFGCTTTGAKAAVNPLLPLTPLLLGLRRRRPVSEGRRV